MFYADSDTKAPKMQRFLSQPASRPSKLELPPKPLPTCSSFDTASDRTPKDSRLKLQDSVESSNDEVFAKGTNKDGKKLN